jgi:hypothetical protein
VWDAAAKVELPFAAACALLMQESSGGHNEYGHDKRTDPVTGEVTLMPFYGAGQVTETNYAQYVAERDSFDPPRCQGVGPTQLTSHSYQELADRNGGCWDPPTNMEVGFGIIAGWRSMGRSWHDCWLGYSGGKESYAQEMDVKHAWWKAILNP